LKQQISQKIIATFKWCIQQNLYFLPVSSPCRKREWSIHAGAPHQRRRNGGAWGSTAPPVFWKEDNGDRCYYITVS